MLLRAEVNLDARGCVLTDEDKNAHSSCVRFAFTDFATDAVRERRQFLVIRVA